MSYAYFHRDGKGAWHGYDAKTNAAIEAARPLEATLTLRYPDNPEKYRTFEIRFGAKAVSRRLKSPPSKLRSRSPAMRVPPLVHARAAHFAGRARATVSHAGAC